MCGFADPEPEYDSWNRRTSFDAKSMCCACDGGWTVNYCALTSGPFKDAGGDGCEWYENKP